VGAIAAFLAGRNHRRAVSESESDTSRDSDEETSIDSQPAAIPRDAAPSAYECLRPPSSGKDHPYYAAAAAMTAGAAGVAAVNKANGGLYDDEEPEDESKLGQRSSSNQELGRVEEEVDVGMPLSKIPHSLTGTSVTSMVSENASVTAPVGAGAATAIILTTAAEATDSSEGLANESQRDLPADNNEGSDASTFQADSAGVEGTNVDPTVVGSVHGDDTVAAGIGGRALTAMALTANAQASDSVHANRSNAESASQSGDSSSESGSAYTSNDSCAEKATDVASLGVTTEGKSTEYTPLAHSASAGASSSRSYDTNATVIANKKSTFVMMH
jgi:hypothetical protein